MNECYIQQLQLTDGEQLTSRILPLQADLISLLTTVLAEPHMSGGED